MLGQIRLAGEAFGDHRVQFAQPRIDVVEVDEPRALHVCFLLDLLRLNRLVSLSAA
ncbi:MAG: hypothetical protein H0U56_06560 [Methylibium sp.]|nr:hypothetical protein [Methylibium sp.]